MNPTANTPPATKVRRTWTKCRICKCDTGQRTTFQIECAECRTLVSDISRRIGRKLIRGDEEQLLRDPDRAARREVYRRRAEAKLPLFDPPVTAGGDAGGGGTSA